MYLNVCDSALPLGAFDSLLFRAVSLHSVVLYSFCLTAAAFLFNLLL